MPVDAESAGMSGAENNKSGKGYPLQNKHKEVREMAMEAIGNVGSVGVNPVQDVRQAERVVSFPEGGQQNQEAGASVNAQSQPAVSAAPAKEQGNSFNDMSVTPSRLERTEEQIEADNERVKKAISEMNKKMTSNSEAVFGIHEDTNRITIKIVDKTTKETIKELPPEKTLDMIAKVWELAGLMVDERG
jgi:flagellar protein FlaG